MEESRRVRLRALRGAITVDENDADAIVGATEELVHEVMERNELDADDLVSCIFTCTDDLDAEFPALAARRLGLDRVPLLCAREIDVPGRAAAGDQAARALLRRAGRRPATCTCARLWRCGATWRALSDARVQHPRGRHPGLPGRRHLRLRRRAGQARLERDAVAAAPAGARGGGGGDARAQPLPGPGEGAAPAADRGAHRRTSRRAWPSGNGSCEILLAAAEAMLEPGAEIVYAWPSFSMYPHLAAMTGARAVDGAARRGGAPRPRRDGPRGHRGHPHRDRLQPEQPHRHGAAAARRSTRSWPRCRATWP